MNQFLHTNFFLVQSVGCFKDTSRRAIPILEGKSLLLRGSYRARKFAIKKCALEAVKRGYNFIGVQHGGQCFSGPRARYTYAKYGRSNRCRNGKGGGWANNVYRVSGIFQNFCVTLIFELLGNQSLFVTWGGRGGRIFGNHVVFMGERKGDHSSPTEYKGVI